MPYSQFIPWLIQHGLDLDLFSASSSPRASVRFSRSMSVVLRWRSSSSLYSADSSWCPTRVAARPFLWLACHSDYRYFFTCGNAI